MTENAETKTSLQVTMARRRLRELLDRCPLILVQYARTEMSGGLNTWRWYRNVYVLDFHYQGDGNLLRVGTYTPNVRCINGDIHTIYDCLSLADGVLEFRSHDFGQAPALAISLSLDLYNEPNRLNWMVIP